MQIKCKATLQNTAAHATRREYAVLYCTYCTVQTDLYIIMTRPQAGSEWSTRAFGCFGRFSRTARSGFQGLKQKNAR